MAVARILVLLNIREGLKEFLNLTDLGRTRVQILDYKGIPFHCRICHEYGHIIKDYNYSSRGHINRRSIAENGGATRRLSPKTPSLPPQILYRRQHK
jgi:hypothetical protein